MQSCSPLLSRRSLVSGMLGGAFAARAARAEAYEIVDFHAHVEEPRELEPAIKQARAAGVKLGVLWHAGKKEYNYRNMILDDAAMETFLQFLEGKPVYRGIQAEGPDWMECFSKKMIARLDYVLTDALTFRERNGKMVKLWLPEVNVGDPQDFMERYVDWHVEIMATEPIDIMAQPTFLPEYLMPEYDRLWTERRNRKIIDAAVKHRVAIEINSRYNLPRMPFLRMALAAGARFSFGSNAHGLATGKLLYSLQMARELKLEARHIFRPWPSGQKRVES